MRCFGPDPDECCSFYDPHDGGKCLNECSSERMITDIFDCAGMYMYNVVYFADQEHMVSHSLHAFIHTDVVLKHLCRIFLLVCIVFFLIE